jgi:hypothetical protein
MPLNKLKKSASAWTKNENTFGGTQSDKRCSSWRKRAPVKTNVAFDGSLDDDSPVHGSAVSFGIGDYLHVMERYDPNWWIGRKASF